MRKTLAVWLLVGALAGADPPPSVTRTVIFHTNPAGAAIVQLPERAQSGVAESEMSVTVPLQGDNVSSVPLSFEASMPGHKPQVFHMDTKGPDYNLDVNAPVEFAVIERLEPDGPVSAFSDWMKGNPGLVGAMVAVLVGAVGVAIFVVQSRKAPPPSAVALEAPKHHLDFEVATPTPTAPPPPVVPAPSAEPTPAVTLEPLQPVPPPPEEPKSHRDYEVEPEAAPAPAPGIAFEPLQPVPPPPEEPKSHRDYEVEPEPTPAPSAGIVIEPLQPVPPPPPAAEAEPPEAEAAEPEPEAAEPSTENAPEKKKKSRRNKK